MPKIPTFQSESTITSEGSSVQTNLQISPSQNIFTATKPLTDFVTQQYIKEKKLEEQNKVDKLIADSYKDNENGPVGFLTLSSETGKNPIPSEASNNYDSGVNNLYDYLTSTKGQNLSRFGKQIFKTKFYSSANQLKANALLESRKAQFKESSDIDNDFITQKVIAYSALPNGTGLSLAFQDIDTRIDQNDFYKDQPQLKEEVRKKYKEFAASGIAERLLLNNPSLLKKQILDGVYNDLSSDALIELSTKADLQIKDQKFSSLTNAISLVGLGDVSPNALKQIVSETLSGNFAGDKNLQSIYNSLTDTEKKEFRTFTIKKAREKRNELLFEVQAADAAIKLTTAENFDKALNNADVKTGIDQKVIQNIFSGNLDAQTQMTDLNTKIIDNAEQGISIISDYDSNNAISALIATDKINNATDRFILPGENTPRSIVERYGSETDFDDLNYYKNILLQQNQNPELFKKTFAPFQSFLNETKNLISTEVIKILDPKSYNNDLKRFKDDMYILYNKGIEEGKSPLELLDYKNKNYIGKDYIQYQTDKNKIFKNMMDNIPKKEIDENLKRLPNETPSEYLKRIGEN